MSIRPETLKHYLVTKRISQAELAREARLSPKTVGRILRGGTERQSQNTITRIARALNIKPADLAAPVESSSGYEEFRDVAIVEARYGISRQRLQHAAPLLFSILAEMSLEGRRQRIQQIEQKIHELSVTPHLGALGGGSSMDAMLADLRAAVANERAAIRRSDLSYSGNDGEFDFEEDLFVAFLDELVARLPADRRPKISGSLNWLEFSLGTTEFDGLTGGDELAELALLEGHASPLDIPRELRSPERSPALVAWLRSMVPAERVREWEVECAVEFAGQRLSIVADGEQEEQFCELSGGDPYAHHALMSGLVGASDIPPQLLDSAQSEERAGWIRAQLSEEICAKLTEQWVAEYRALVALRAQRRV